MTELEIILATVSAVLAVFVWMFWYHGPKDITPRIEDAINRHAEATGQISYVVVGCYCKQCMSDSCKHAKAAVKEGCKPRICGCSICKYLAEKKLKLKVKK